MQCIKTALSQNNHLLYCSVPGAEPHTYYVRAPEQVGQSQRTHACCTGQELVATVICPLSHCVQPGRQRTGNPPYHVSCLPAWPVSGKMRCNSSGLSPTLPGTLHPTVLLELCHRVEELLHLEHLPQVCSLLLSDAGTGAGRTLQPDTRLRARSHRSFVWEPESVMPGAELRRMPSLPGRAVRASAPAVQHPVCLPCPLLCR